MIDTTQKQADAVHENNAVDQENSPKNDGLSDLEFEESESDLSSLYVRDEADSSCGAGVQEDGDWEIVDSSVIAVDYSNVHVFLKTLQAWQG